MNKGYSATVMIMLVGLAVLGALAIDQAYKAQKALLPPPTRVSELSIVMDDDMFRLRDGIPFLKLQNGKEVNITLTIKSSTDRTLHPELFITYGPGNEQQVLPNGVVAEFHPGSVELLPRHESKINLHMRVYGDAPDGTYVIAITAYDKKNNESNGTGFTLVVGEGSRYYIGPNGPIGPAPKFEGVTNP